MFNRDSYRGLLEILLKLVQDEGLAVYNAEKPAVREQGKHSRGSIITGQPGIGKAFFGSFLLVQRLLCELPTVLQHGTPKCGIFHFIFSEGGVCSLGDLPPAEQLFRDVTVSELVDKKPIGGLANLQLRMFQNWLLVSTSP